MRALVWVVGIAAVLYSALWFAGERLIETRAPRALADLEAQGWTVDYASLNTTGFPSRLDTTVTDLALVSPDGALAWAAPAVTVYALTWRPNHVIVELPPQQTVTVAGREVAVGSEGLRASARVGLSTRAPFREAVVESGPLTVAGAGVEVALGRLLLAAREGGPAADAAANAYDLYLDAGDLVPGGGVPGLDLVHLDAQVTLAAPLDRFTRTLPPLLGIALRDARLERGDVALAASGQLAPDAQGALEGEIVLVAENWRGMLDLAQQAGVLDAGRRTLFESALEGLAQGEDRIEVPVTFADGTVSALGLPLLASPVLPATP